MPAQKLTAKILGYINDYPGSTIKDLSIALGISVSMARAIIYRLKNNGYVEKAGMGYYITDKGLWLLSKMTGGRGEKREKTIEETREEKEAPIEEKPKGDEDISKVEGIAKGKGLESLIERIDTLERRIEDLENRVRDLESYLKRINNKFSSMGRRKGVGGEQVLGRRGVESEKTLPIPVMSIPDARNKLGSLYDKLIYEGRIIEVNTVVVDREFYDEFIKKFPITVKDAEKLPPLEKKLLDEMKKDARVILKAGKRYELVR